MTSAEQGASEARGPSVVRNADILMYDEGLFCGTEKGSIVPIEQRQEASNHSWDWACVAGFRPFRVGSRMRTFPVA